MTELSLGEIKRAADFYGITLEEGKRRYEVVQAQGDNPADPICIGCARRPHEIDAYKFAAMEDEDDEPATTEQVRGYVIEGEGTYNRSNGHFLCDSCYIKNGQPSRSFPDRWVCP